MSQSATSKICGLCGEDCSNRPRTKDKAGKYFCKKCYDEAMQKKRHQRTTNGEAIDNAFLASVDSESERGLLAALVDQQQAKLASDTKSRFCPQCTANVSDGATLCVACGYDMQSGKLLSVKVKKPPREPILGNWTGPAILSGILLTFLAIGFFGAEHSMVIAGTYIAGWFLLSLIYLYWVVRSAGLQGGTLLALAVFFIPFFYLYFVFVQHPGRYLKIATVVQLLAIGVTMHVAGHLENDSADFDRIQAEFARPRVSPNPSIP